jgi:anti-sigma regulatory factor (Ser/Thr protein kinase)
VPEATLTIPPSPEHVRLARLVAVAAARRAGLGDEQVDDVRLAVAEGVSRAVARHRAGGLETEVLIGISDSPGSFGVDITDQAEAQAAETDDGIALALIRALVPEVEQAGSVLRLRWKQAS